MGEPSALSGPDLYVLRWLRAHGPATLGQLAAAAGQPTTNFGRQRIGPIDTLIESLSSRELVEESAGDYTVSDLARQELAEAALRGELPDV